MKLPTHPIIVRVVTATRLKSGGQLEHVLRLERFEWKSIGPGAPEARGQLWIVGVQDGRRYSIPMSQVIDIIPVEVEGVSP